MAAYFDSGGNQIKGNTLKKYLKALAAAEKAGTPYTGNKYYTQQEVEAMYNGAPLGIIQQLGQYKSWLNEAPAEYSAMTADQLKAAAAAKVESDYQGAKTTSTNTYNNNLLALQNSLAALDQPYTSQLNSAQKTTSQNVDSLTGTMLSRGLGRSSYAGALQSNTLKSGADTMNSIMADKTSKTNEINSQVAQLGTNYNNALAALDTSKASQVDSTYQSLQDQDYQKQLASSQARTDYFLNLLQQKKKVSNGATYNSTRSTNTTATNTTSNTTGSSLQDLANALLGG